MIQHLIDKLHKPFDIITSAFPEHQEPFSKVIVLVFTSPMTGNVYNLFSLSGDTAEFEFNNIQLYAGESQLDLTCDNDDPDGEPYRQATAQEKKLFLDFMRHNKGFMRYVWKQNRDELPRAIYDFNQLYEELQKDIK